MCIIREAWFGRREAHEWTRLNKSTLSGSRYPSQASAASSPCLRQKSRVYWGSGSRQKWSLLLKSSKSSLTFSEEDPVSMTSKTAWSDEFLWGSENSETAFVINN